MSFRVSETQLRVADGAVRCGACLHVFQAEEYFISPMLDITEQLAIQQEYWENFDRYLFQLFGQEKVSGVDSACDIRDRSAFDVVNERAAAVTGSDDSSDTSLREEAPPTDLSDYDPADIVPTLNEQITPEEFEEAFAVYADAGLVPIDTVQPESVGQGDLFDASYVDAQRQVPVTQSVESNKGGESESSPASDDSLMDFYLDFVDQHPGVSVETPPTDNRAEPLPTGLTIIETRDKADDDDPQSLGLDIEADPDELTAPRRGGVTNAMIGWFVASLSMIGIGFLQYVYFNKNLYAQNEAYRPWYLSACRYIGCDLPEYDRIELLKTRELIVRTHPSEPDALTVDVLLSNNGDFRQLFPGLELTFFNIQGEKAASRVFTVSEYLGGELRGLRYIPARTEVRLSLELVDPGNEALGYEMQVVPL